MVDENTHPTILYRALISTINFRYIWHNLNPIKELTFVSTLIIHHKCILIKKEGVYKQPTKRFHTGVFCTINFNTVVLSKFNQLQSRLLIDIKSQGRINKLTKQFHTGVFTLFLIITGVSFRFAFLFDAGFWYCTRLTLCHICKANKWNKTGW